MNKKTHTKGINITGWQITLIVTAILGVCVVALGYFAELPFLTPIGGALFGSCFGSLIGRIANRELSEDIKETVASAVKSDFVSEENKIAGLRNHPWHLYHVTKRAGKFVWAHTVIDFGKFHVPGRLFAETFLLNKAGKRIDYTFEAGVRDSRLVLINKARASQEPCGVYIFPFVGLEFDDCHFGLLMHQTWDNTNSVSPTFIARNAVEGIVEEGPVSDEQSKTLDQLWEKNATNEGDLLPRVFNR